MPRYEFICDECRKEFEQTLHFEDLEKLQELKLKCPHCGSEKVEREIASFFAVTAKKS